MATAKPLAYGPVRWRRRLVLGAGLAMAAVVALGWSALATRALAGASYAARLGCSCHFVSGRSLDDCKADFDSGVGPVWLSADAAEKTVTARYLVLAHQTATFHEGQGCLLEPWPHGNDR